MDSNENSVTIENAQISLPIDTLSTIIANNKRDTEGFFHGEFKTKQFSNNEWKISDTESVNISTQIENQVLTITFEILKFYATDNQYKCYFVDHVHDDKPIEDTFPKIKKSDKETQTYVEVTSTTGHGANIEPVPPKRKRGRPKLNKTADSNNDVRKPLKKSLKNVSIWEKDHNHVGEINLMKNLEDNGEVSCGNTGKPQRYGLRGVKLNAKVMNAVKGFQNETLDETEPNKRTIENNVEDSEEDPDKSEENDSDYSDAAMKRVKHDLSKENVNQNSTAKNLKPRKKRKPGVIACKICNKLLCDYTGVYNHVMRKHSKRRKIAEYLDELTKLQIVQCGLCNAEFSNSLKLNQHIEIKHTEVEPCQCSECGKSFKNLWSLRTHFKSMHVNEQSKSNLCHLCSAAFKTLSNLNQHIKQTHLRKKEFSCKICSKRFCSKPLLKRHSRSHGLDESKRVYCKFCSKSFLFEFNLRRHIAGVHLQHSEKFHCSYCGKGFGHKSGMITHIQAVHFNLFAYSCQECSASFPKSSMLKTHMISYHGNQDFVLPELPSKNGVYDRTTENMFYCSYCSTGFKHKAKLVEHMHTDHATAFPHMCSICNQGFLEKSFINVHNLKVHNLVEMETDTEKQDQLNLPSGSGEILQFITTKEGCPSKIIAMIHSGQESSLITYRDSDSVVTANPTLEHGTLVVEVADGCTTTQYMVEAPDGIVNSNAVVQDISNLLLAAGQTLQTDINSAGVQEISLVIENPKTGVDGRDAVDNVVVTSGGELVTSNDLINTNGDVITVVNSGSRDITERTEYGSGIVTESNDIDSQGVFNVIDGQSGSQVNNDINMDGVTQVNNFVDRQSVAQVKMGKTGFTQVISKVDSQVTDTFEGHGVTYVDNAIDVHDSSQVDDHGDTIVTTSQVQSATQEDGVTLVTYTIDGCDVTQANEVVGDGSVTPDVVEHSVTIGSETLEKQGIQHIFNSLPNNTF